MLARLQAMADTGTLRYLDVQFAGYLHQVQLQHSDQAADLDALSVAAALVSYELGQGNVCLDLFRADRSACWDTAADSISLPAPDAWRKALQRSVCVGAPDEDKPLILDGHRLYLNRYWRYEVAVADALKRRCEPVALDMPLLSKGLTRLFARDYAPVLVAAHKAPRPALRRMLEQRLHIEHSEALDWDAIYSVLKRAQSLADLQALDRLIPQHACLDWQQIAALVAAGRRFSVISGGPGTGKTTTVTRLLALMVEQEQARGRNPIIKLVAPTGKAAARLTESIGQAKQALPVEQTVREAIPEEAQTLHRLLGTVPGQRRFRHHRDNPLHLDLLVVDEASMVDLPLMARLLDALPEKARVVLLGDKDQLASVEAGSVLGDICSGAKGYSTELADTLETLTGYDLAGFRVAADPGVQDGFCLLRRSFRFDAQSGIGALARAINQGDPQRIDSIWQAGYEDVQFHPLDSSAYTRMLDTCVEAYRPYLQLVSVQAAPAEVLAAFGNAQLLCALRDGPFGVSGLNQQVAAALRKRGLITQVEGWYPGRPVMVTRNDYALELFNGDIGIVLPDPASAGALRVFFELPDKRIRKILPSRLPEHETVYAMTVHKSQGSEFQRCVLLLPPESNPVVTRELVYTGITRAKSRLELFGRSATLARAVATPTERVSGLAQRLWDS